VTAGAAPARPVIVAVDGPAAAGKGTLARSLAAALGLPHLDTGLLYRAVARRVLDAGGEPSDTAAAAAAAAALQAADLARADLRGPEMDRAASAVAAIAAAALLAFQRCFGAVGGAVLDGRDIGTVVFPDAAAKLFVTASVAARAERRWRELRSRGTDADLAGVEAELRARDAQDMARDVAPLRQAADAMLLDTTALEPAAAAAAALALVRARLAALPVHAGGDAASTCAPAPARR
jgi:cytidylate kinase